MNKISTIKLLPSNKQELNNFTEGVISAVMEGELNVLELDYHLKYMEEMISKIRKNEKVRSLLIDEISKYEKRFTFRNSEITLSEKRTMDYSTDAGWVVLKEKIKERENILKALKDNMVDEETGECYSQPIVKKSDVITYKLL